MIDPRKIAKILMTLDEIMLYVATTKSKPLSGHMELLYRLFTIYPGEFMELRLELISLKEQYELEAKENG